MITKFTSVYAGHMDLPDRGQDEIGTLEAVMLEQFQWLAEEAMPVFPPPRR